MKLKQRIFKRHSSSYWPNIGVGDIEKFAIFNLVASAWYAKSRFVQSDMSTANRVVETLLTVNQRFLVSSGAIYNIVSQIDCPTSHIHTEIEPYTSCVISLVQYNISHSVVSGMLLYVSFQLQCPVVQVSPV